MPSISTTATLTPRSVRAFLVFSRVLATLSMESKVQEGGLNEKRLLNQLLFGEGPTPPTEEAEENVEVPVLGPARSLLYGTGSMVTDEKLVSMLQQDIV